MIHIRKKPMIHQARRLSACFLQELRCSFLIRPTRDAIQKMILHTTLFLFPITASACFYPVTMATVRPLGSNVFSYLQILHLRAHLLFPDSYSDFISGPGNILYNQRGVIWKRQKQPSAPNAIKTSVTTMRKSII